MDGKWQTVSGTKKKDRKPQQSSAGVPQDGRAASANGTPSAFAALDASWRGRNDAKQSNAHSESLANGTSGAHGVDGSTDDGGSSEASADHSQQLVGAKRKKPKAPKAKKPTPASAAAALKLGDIASVMEAARQRYAADERVQLDTLADHFVSVFRDAELPFNKLLAEQPLPKVAKTPADAVPADVAQAVSDFMAAKDAAAVAAFAGALIDAAFDAMPESANRLQQAPPKANVGLLVALALALRAKPAALVLDADRLAAGGRRYTAPGRLPLLLWLLAQTAQSSEAVALAVWVRVLLPQILGSPAPAVSAAAAPGRGASAAILDRSQPQQQAPPQQAPQLSEASAVRAFQYLDGLLGSPAVKRDMARGVTVQEGQPPAALVPPAALLALLQAVHQPGRLQGDAALLTRSHQGILRTIALSGVPDGGMDAGEVLRLALDAAAEGGGAEEPLVVACAHLVIEALAADDAAFPAWQSRHKAQLRGSSRVLAALQAAYPDALMPLLAVPAKRAAFVALMPALQQRHQYALRSGKGWQGAAARTADAAAVALRSKVQRDGGKSAARSIAWTIGGGVGLSLAVRTLTGGSPLEHPLVEMVTRSANAVGLTSLLQQAAVKLQPYTQQAADVVWPHLQPAVQAATPYVQQAAGAVQPLMQQASDAASQASEYALETLRNVTAAWQ